MKAITIRVEEDFRMKLKIYAATKNKSMKEVIIDSINHLIEEDKEEERSSGSDHKGILL